MGSWSDPAFKQAFVERVFGIVEEHAPGFRDSIVGFDALSPLDLERIFGLHKGNIFHGAIALHQLAYFRPAPGMASHRTPIQGLYLVRRLLFPLARNPHLTAELGARGGEGGFQGASVLGPGRALLSWQQSGPSDDGPAL